MNDILYSLALILIIGWFLGFFIFNLSGFIHLLLITALAAIFFRLLSEKHA